MYILNLKQRYYIQYIININNIFCIHQGCIEKANSKYTEGESSISWLKYISINSNFIYLFDNTILYLVIIFLICHILK